MPSSYIIACCKSECKEKKIRKKAIKLATRNAIIVPFNVMKISYSAYELMEAMAVDGNPNSISDVGVGAIAIHAGIKGAWLNVKINAADFDDKEFIKGVYLEAQKILMDSDRMEGDILKIVGEKIGAKT